MSKIKNNKILKLIFLQILILFILIGLYLFFNSNLDDLIMPKCFWNENYGVLCPSCGATRCLQNLFAGNIINAFYYNPFICMLAIYLIVLDIVYFVNTIFNKNILKFIYPKWWYVIIYFSIWAIYTIIINVI